MGWKIRLRWLLALFLGILPGFLPGTDLRAEMAGGASGLEAFLGKALAAIRNGDAGRSGIREAVSLLEAEAPRFPNEIRIPLYLAEGYYRMADPDADVAREFPLYEKSGRHARTVLSRDPGRTEARYWHGLYLLKKAQKTGGLGAYFFVRKGIRELERVREAIPEYDRGGASRVLALLYYTAPGWTPFGDIDKSVALAEEAVRIDPAFPLNRLYLAEAYNKRGDREAAAREYRRLADPADGGGADAEAARERARHMLREMGRPVPGS